MHFGFIWSLDSELLSSCLSELKLKQSEEGGLKGQGGLNPPAETCRSNIDQRGVVPAGTELLQLNNNTNTSKPNVEETVNLITNRLKERRRELGIPDSIKVGTAEMPSLHTHGYYYSNL